MRTKPRHPFKVGQMYKHNGMRYQFQFQNTAGALHFVRFEDTRPFDYSVDAARQMFNVD